MQIFNVTGSYKGIAGVKKFNTVEEMNQSTGNKEGDLGIIYHRYIKNINKDINTKKLYFPEQVILPQQVPQEGIDVVFEYTADGNLTGNEAFRCTIYPNELWGEIVIYSPEGESYEQFYYNSSDGVTFNRDSNESISFGRYIKFGTIYNNIPWNDLIGYFFQYEASDFNTRFHKNAIRGC